VYACRHYFEETRHVGLDLYRSLAVSPEECQECESCMEVCPAGIPIPERLKEAVALFAEVEPL